MLCLMLCYVDFNVTLSGLKIVSNEIKLTYLLKGKKEKKTQHYHKLLSM